MSSTSSLTPEKALIFRITHRVKALVEMELAERSKELEVKTFPRWFF